MRRVTTITLAAIATFAACAPASAATTTISPSGVRFPQVAIAPGGRTIVAWERLGRRTFGFEARVGPGPRRLGARVRLASNAYSPKVAAGADGTVAVMWLQSGPGDRVSSLRVAIARPGHRLGAGQLVGSAPGRPRALPADGSAVAAWSIQTDDPAGFSIIARRTVAAIAGPGAAFGTPVELTPAGQRYSAPSVAAATGAAFVATARPRGPVLVATRELGAPAFGPVTTLAARGDGDVEVAAGGRHAVAVYQVHDRVRLTVLR